MILLGYLITFEGVEGSGKSTQIGLLKSYLEEAGREVLTVREPGGTAIGERIREILLSSAGDGMEAMTELLLYASCRSEIVNKVIRPALKGGKVVICDRFTDSTIAYQGYARGLELSSIEAINKLATGGLIPSLTFLLDLDPKLGLERALERMNASDRTGCTGHTGPKEDRFERESLLFHHSVREGFLTLACDEPTRIKLIDADRPVEELQREISSICKKLLLG